MVRIVSGGVHAALMALVGLAILTAPITALAEEKKVEEKKAPPPVQGPLWSKQCVKDQIDPKGHEVCFVQQFAVAMPQNTVILNVMIGYLGPRGALRMILTAPLGIFLLPGLQSTIDHDKPFTLPLESCDTNGCRTAVDLDESSADKLREGKLLNVRFVLMNRKAMDVPIKLDGLTAALKTVAP